MIKSLYLTPLLLLMAVMLGGCTHNNGDIGPWFGEWKLTSITVDGVPDTDYDGNIFWAFQTTVIEMLSVDDETTADYRQRWGTWAQDGTVLTLDFTHSDDRNPAGSDKYIPFPATGLPAGVSELDILSLSGSEIKLSYTADDGKVYGYLLKKWG
ncbi:MAG: lipocalin-like domain-containing protein [Pseudoflavonifractor sp.]|nr:lipocalin-like domain-containing protein [Pseudoflavonifractor sp.]